jgi:hypothetical protein
MAQDRELLDAGADGAAARLTEGDQAQADLIRNG